MLVAKICLTGGPCAGKTSALKKIKEELTSMGYKVFIINEEATRLINEGIKPFGNDKINMLDFEDIMLKEQLTQEEVFVRVANLLDNKCIIICDRGVFDIKTFLSKEEFNYLINKYNLSTLELMDGYNLVISLNTTAKGALAFYTTENNNARTEGIKEAIIKDDNCIDAWCSNNNFMIVDNSTDFNGKLDKIVDGIKNYLGILEKHEKKYLVELTDELVKELNKKDAVCIDIKQTYLNTNKNYEMRLRKKTLDGNSTYFITAKKNDHGNQKIIVDEKIDRKTYERLLNERKIINEVNKKRVCFSYNNNVYKLDKFENGMYLLETSPKVQIPSFINVIKDVTLDDNYYNIHIKDNKACIIKKGIIK